jgi:hypothetical protein
MLSRFKQPALILILAGLAALVLVRGVLPAFSAIRSDFPNYFTAAKIVADGGDTARLYDEAWFQEQMRRYAAGGSFTGKFSPFPPASALLLLPLTGLGALDALRVLTALSVAALAASVVLLARIIDWGPVVTGILVLLSGFALVNCLRNGQPYIIMSLSFIAGYHHRAKGRPWLAGVCFGLFLPIKYFSVVFLAYFACRKEWRLVLGGAAAALCIGLAGIAVLGWSIHEEFFRTVLGNHLVGKLGMQDPFSAGFQSFDSLFRRLFLYDPVSNPQPLLASRTLQILATAGVKASILGAAIVILSRLNRNWPEVAVAPSLGIIGVLALLLAPATASYHFVLLWLPLGLLVAYLVKERACALAAALVLMYAAIGFFPYRLTEHFEGRGALCVLAYPRLWLLTGILAASLCFFRGRAPRPPQAAA